MWSNLSYCSCIDFIFCTKGKILSSLVCKGIHPCFFFICICFFWSTWYLYRCIVWRTYSVLSFTIWLLSWQNTTYSKIYFRFFLSGLKVLAYTLVRQNRERRIQVIIQTALFLAIAYLSCSIRFVESSFWREENSLC